MHFYTVLYVGHVFFFVPNIRLFAALIPNSSQQCYLGLLQFSLTVLVLHWDIYIFYLAVQKHAVLCSVSAWCPVMH